jgi:hypothetical protein
MTADHTRAMRRVHAVAKSYGIAHELLSAWADDVHHAESLTDVPADKLDDLSRQMEAEGDDFASVFIDTYGPRSIMQFALIDMPEAVEDRWVS